MFDLPEHLSSLNALAPSPQVLDQSAEDAVWNYLNTDELFRNFGVPPSELHQKDEVIAAPSPTPVAAAEDKKSSPPADLKSFLEQFAAQEQAQAPPAFSHDFGLNMPFASGSSAPTPAMHTMDLLQQSSSTPNWLTSPEDDKPSGAKKLKSLGAGQAEIEEDSKRRRNTEASARFRAKKKEREQNLEQRAKELEAQVAQLAADKASLENENRLLKAIVLGGSGGQSSDALAQLVGGANGKRKRDEA